MSGPEDILKLKNNGVEDKLKAFEKRERAKEIADMKEALTSPVVKRILNRLLDRSGAFLTPYAGDVNLTHINIGKQELGQWLIVEIDIAKPNAISEMMREKKSALVVKEQIINNIKSGKDQGET